MKKLSIARFVSTASVAGLLATVASLTSSPSMAQQSALCLSQDARCLNDAFSAACAESGTTLASCLAGARDLEVIYGETGASAAGTALGFAFYTISERFAADEAKADYRERVRELALEIVSNDSAARDAYLLLSFLHEGEESIQWLHKAVEVDESGRWLGHLVSAHQRLMTMQGALDAIVIAEDAYHSALSGESKWERALLASDAYAHALYLNASMETRRARDDFVARVREDSGWDHVARALNYETDDAAELRRLLHTACGPLAGIFGEAPCILGLHAAMHGARSVDGERAEAFAEAAAHGMVRFRVPSSIVVQSFTWNDVFRSWLAELKDGGFSSVALYEAWAGIPGGQGLHRILDARLAIIELEPNSGLARFELGKAYFDVRQWEPAIEQFEIARTLLTEERQLELGIPSYLRSAAYELAPSH